MSLGIPHHDLGEAVLAVCVPESDGHAFLHESEAIRILHSKLANYKIPKRFLCLDQLPRNAMGKVQKNILRERYHSLFCTQ